MSLEGPSAERGKWSKPGVPHKGWECIETEDLGFPDKTCAMCETVDIRYVQYMRHANYPDVLACGVICAGHMEGNLVRAEVRDKTMRSSATRRQAFPDRKGWKRNAKGNWLLKSVGIRVTVFERNGRWGAVVNHPQVDSIFTQGTFDTSRKAMFAAFDTYMAVDEKVQKIKRMSSSIWDDDD